MPSVQKISPCLWFDREAEEAANHYVSIFPNARIVNLSRYGEAGPLPKGTVLTVVFELEGQRFMALNGGPSSGCLGRSSRRCWARSWAAATRRARTE